MSRIWPKLVVKLAAVQVQKRAIANFRGTCLATVDNGLWNDFCCSAVAIKLRVADTHVIPSAVFDLRQVPNTVYALRYDRTI